MLDERISQKPLLYNGFIINDELTVKNRVERIFFTEVYLLSNDQYLYLFMTIKHDEVIGRGKRYNLVTIISQSKQYLGVIQDEHSHKKVCETIDDLTVMRGFDCVAGMKELKTLLFNDVINPLSNPEKYLKFKLTIPNGILLYGPPGCGKTFIVKKLAEELGFNYIELHPSTVATSYVHGAVCNIAKTFELAKQQSPSIIFIDEIEGLIPRREDLGGHADTKKEEINEFLLQLNNSSDNKVLVVGATNRPHIIDTAILRSGRMDKRVYVGPPDFDAREEMFQICLSGRPYDKNINFSKLSEMTANYVSSDIELIVTESARIAVFDNRPFIDEAMIIASILKVSPSISLGEIEYFEQFRCLNR